MIETVAEIASTNSALLARLGQGDLHEGHWLVADRQTAGRGRAGRHWNDGLGNFMGSTVARLMPGDPPAPTLALVAGVALHRTLGAIPGIVLKWPNDVLVDGAKLAGILLERQGDAVVVGIGVNLASAPTVPDRQTVALVDLPSSPLPFRGGAGGGESRLGSARGDGPHPNPRSEARDSDRPEGEGPNGTARDAFAQALASEWQLALALWHQQGWPALREEWLARAHPRGTLLSVRDREAGTIIGAFAGLEPDGAALLRLADGATHAIHAGDIEIVRD